MEMCLDYLFVCEKINYKCKVVMVVMMIEIFYFIWFMNVFYGILGNVFMVMFLFSNRKELILFDMMFLNFNGNKS